MTTSLLYNLLHLGGSNNYALLGIIRGVGRSRILGGPSACAIAPETDDNQKISVNDIILGAQGADPPEARAISSNLRVKSWNFIPFSLQTFYSKEYQL